MWKLRRHLPPIFSVRGKGRAAAQVVQAVVDTIDVAQQRRERQRVIAREEERLSDRMKRYATMASDQWLVLFKYVATDPRFDRDERMRRTAMMIDERIAELIGRTGNKSLPDTERARYALERHWLRNERRAFEPSHQLNLPRVSVQP